MATIHRFGTALLLIGGLALASLMAYILLIDIGAGAVPGQPLSTDVADVAIVFPEQSYSAWEDFRRGVLACRDLDLVSNVVDQRTALSVTTRGGRRLSFHWQPASGFLQTRQEALDLLARRVPPVAVVGSENTALTTALAESLSSAVGPNSDEPGPVLLVPWATAIDAEPDPPGSKLVPLLGIYPGRTFRFCPDNQRAAELIVRYALDQTAGASPARAIVVSDPADPFSRDLARAFREGLRTALPGSPVVDRDATPIPPRPSAAPDPSESQWAEAIWSEARKAAAEGPFWLVLTLQSEPTRRLLNALCAQAPRDADAIPLCVLSGDGVGVGSLARLAGALPFPVWVASAGFAAARDRGIPEGAQVMAEIVLALARALDQSGEPGDLAGALRRLQVPAQALGRSIAFKPTGERRGDDLGQVLAIEPGSLRVVARSRRSDGGWTDPVAVAPEQP